MPLVFLIIPSIICALYGLYKGLNYMSDEVNQVHANKRNKKWR